MKIGQITLPSNWNYGGILQCYALKHVLHDLGHESVVISRRKNRDNFFLRSIVWFKWGGLKMLSHVRIFWIFPIVSVEGFKRKFIKDYTVDIFSDKKLKLVIEKYDFSAFVVGSDQIWNYTAAPHINDAFLDFVSDRRNIKRISYAASFGRDDWRYPAELTEKCRKLASQFDAVSVREDTGIDLCRTYLNVEALHHVDPTLLLNKNDYLNIIGKSKTSTSNGSLLLYILDSSLGKKKIVDSAVAELGLIPFGVRQFEKRKILVNALKGIYPSVEQWLKCFYDAKFVITDSFHGTIFAIIFNKPFITIGNKERGMARFESLLRDLNLLDRLVGDDAELDKKLLSLSGVDWGSVNKIIEDRQKLGIQYLKENLRK